jgi:hypothetical protein
MRVTRGRVVLAKGQEQPYLVVLEDEWGGRSEHLVGTIRDGEAMIRLRMAPARPEVAEQMRQSRHRD